MSVAEDMGELPSGMRLEHLLINAMAEAANAGRWDRQPHLGVTSMGDYLAQARKVCEDSPELHLRYTAQADAILQFAKAAVENRIKSNDIITKVRGGEAAITQGLRSAGLMDDTRDTSLAAQFLSNYVIP